ncbi:sensor histidine kinase [Dokdonella immobilis]|uniref:sensor histidine kinase n=1 Tax=Dokdonella immobilis TaxID=578942 RepID=UPI001FEAEE43|nr:ATP-binding protein [Dokdonella immobilis]
MRILLLGVAVLASVALPYAIIRNSANETLAASEWVVHSAEVREALLELEFNMSELESLVLLDLVEVPPGERRPRYEAIRPRIEPLIDRLADMTRDNADQQSRIGSLRVLLKGRLDTLDTALQQLRQKNFDAVARTLKQGAETFGSRETSSAIVAAETALFQQRQARLAESMLFSRWTVVAALVAQLLLLGSVIFVSERQVLHRQAAEARARLAVERSRIIVQTMREPIAVLDTSLRVLMTNEAFGEFYRPPEGEPSGARLEEHGDGAWDSPSLMQRLLDVGARGRELWDFELEQASADGIERDVLVNARRMELSEDAEAAGERTILLTVSDITARKRYEKRISELNEDLGAKIEQVSEINRELESFSYSVSHDLRAPLRHIAGFAAKLGEHIGDAADERSRHYLEVISDAARRMSSLIEDLLEYSRLGRSALRLGPVDMNALVAELQAMYESGNEERSINWRIGRLPTVIGDEGMLRRVWQNLISNAVKYTSKRERAEIEIGADSSGSGEVVYYVRDNGTGFDMAYAGKLFGVFQRLHKASEFPGTGIGLANVRRIVGRLGGRTWAEAEPDKGARIHFSLPAVAAAIPDKVSHHES